MFLLRLLSSCLLMSIGMVVWADPLGTEFTYQGELKKLGNVADGTFDFKFDIYDASINGSAVATSVELENVEVVNGVFSVLLDFGSAPFESGDQLWLEIAVRDGTNAETHTVLLPRQKLTPSPYAIASLGSNTPSGAFVQGGNSFGATALLGTTDFNPLEIRIGSAIGYPRVMRYEYSIQGFAGGPNLIGGSQSNSVTIGVRGAVIAGGGSSGDAQVSNVTPNQVTDHYGTISGGFGNRAGDDDANAATAYGATVAGGYNNTSSNIAAVVSGGDTNVASGYRSTVSGGGYHAASGDYSAIGGGYGNKAADRAATVAGGIFNQVMAVGGAIGGGGDTLDSITGSLGTINCTAALGCGNHVSDAYGVVGGGAANRAGSGTNGSDAKWFATVAGGFNSTAGGAYSTVAGGNTNVASGNYGNVGGGWSNTAAGDYAAVAGGRQNSVTGNSSTIAGGWNNSISSSNFSNIGGGQGNAVTGSANYNAIGGGVTNSTNGSSGAIAGGYNNITQGLSSTVGGGYSNQANADYSTVPGGFGNQASGTYSVAMGQGAIVNSNGSFVFSDGSAGQFISGVNNEFIVGATGGIGLYTAKNYATYCRIGAGGGTWNCSSSRAVKRDFAPIDTSEVLRKVSALPLSSWRFMNEAISIRHVGPFAQDFWAAFGLGESDESIAAVDADGIALAAIQGLDTKVDSKLAILEQQAMAKDAQIETLEHEVEELKHAVEILMARINPQQQLTLSH